MSHGQFQSSSFPVGSPLSPTSPRPVASKVHQQQQQDNRQAPQTPPSPPLMSVGAQNYAANFSTAQTSPAHTVSHPAPISSSPPSSVAMSTQTSQQPTITTTNSFPTPASSVSGQFTNANAPDEMECSRNEEGVQSQRGGEVTAAEKDAGSDPMEIDMSGHRRTDHDRDSGESGRNLAENAMELDTNKVTSPAGEGELSLASLQQDVGTAFHVCKTSYSVTGPNPRFDLVSLYGLGPVAASVARTDPVTGEKINRLRKSYEGKIKGLGLAGRNKPVKSEPGAPGSLRHLTMWPEEEWQNQKVHGKAIQVAEPDSSLHRLQMKAMKLEPGQVPNHEFWEDALGHEKQPKHHGQPANPKKNAPPGTISNRPASQVNGTATGASTPTGESSRPRRTGKKRSYNDSSFVGYGEGFPDDDADMDLDFASNSEEGGRSNKKKRKKDHLSNFPERGGSYGVGMFGVGAR